jgi:predicted transcriptional regulator
MSEPSNAFDEEPGIFDLEDDAAVEAATQRGLAGIAAGRTISHEAVRRWLLSWGTDKELPPPECGE